MVDASRLGGAPRLLDDAFFSFVRVVVVAKVFPVVLVLLASSSSMMMSVSNTARHTKVVQSRFSLFFRRLLLLEDDDDEAEEEEEEDQAPLDRQRLLMSRDTQHNKSAKAKERKTNITKKTLNQKKYSKP